MKNKKTIILVCGATGFIGKNVLKYFASKKEYKVHAIYNVKKKIKLHNVQWHNLDLRKPIYKSTAAYGHFGRDEFPWEQINRADDVRSYLGLN